MEREKISLTIRPNRCRALCLICANAELLSGTSFASLRRSGVLMSYLPPRVAVWKCEKPDGKRVASRCPASARNGHKPRVVD
jgi:hypothetical protein